MQKIKKNVKDTGERTNVRKMKIKFEGKGKSILKMHCRYFVHDPPSSIL
jgi:hypothetical protein